MKIAVWIFFTFAIFIFLPSIQGQACQEPPLTDCNAQCVDLPNYATCKDACIANDQVAWESHWECLEATTTTTTLTDEASQIEESDQDEEADSLTARVQNVVGDVTIERDGKKEKVTASTNIRDGDVIKAGLGGSMVVVFEDGSRVNIGPKSQFTLGQGGSEWDLGKLNFGKLKAIFKKFQTRKFAIRTPIAIAGVKGTEFIMTHENGISEIHLFEGTLDITAGGETKELTRGNSMVIDDSGIIETYYLSQEMWDSLSADIEVEDSEQTAEATGIDTPSTGGGFPLYVSVIVLGIAGAAVYFLKKKK